MFGAEAVRRIGAHADQGGLRDHGSRSAAGAAADDTTDTPPFFLYLAMQDVHEPVSAPANYIALHADIDDGTRRTYSGMVSAMDSAIGNVTDALKAAKMWKRLWGRPNFMKRVEKPESPHIELQELLLQFSFNNSHQR